MTKQEMISLIVIFKHPKNPYKRSLERRCIERCGYTKKELEVELETMPEYKSYVREQKLNILGI